MLALLLALSHAADLPDPGRSYDLELSVDPETRRVDGTATIRFTNPSEIPVERIPVHLYVNAYASGVSTWMNEDRGLDRGSFREYGRLKTSEDGWGWSRLVEVRAATPDGPVDVPYGFIAPDDGNPQDRSLAELRLPTPLPPGETLELTVVFETRLPEMSPRTGTAADFVLAGHAVPTLGLMELPEPRPEPDPDAPTDEPPPEPRPHTWHAHQYHAQSEFFAAFADYRATITAPEGWQIDGTGTVEPASGLPEDGVWTLTQPMVHDFSFVVVRGMQERWVEHERASGGTIRVHFLAPADRTPTLDRVQGAVLHGLGFLEAKLGPYPYDSLTVVIPPEAADGSEAIEYATMFLAQNAGSGIFEHPPLDAFKVHELVAAHELAHQYFQGLVATDEVEHAWLDEGSTEYWSHRILEDAAGDEPHMGWLLGMPVDPVDTRSLYARAGKDGIELRDPIWTAPTFLYDRGLWSLQSYDRPSLTWHTLERVFGRERTDAVHRAWFEQGRFRHPTPTELLAVVEREGGPEMAALLRRLVTETGDPDLAVTHVSTWEREAPVGHPPNPDGDAYISNDARGDFDPRLALPFDPAPEDGRIGVLLTEGGAPGRAGGTQVVRAQLELGEDHDPEAPLHLSRARIETPGWPELPVEVVLRFADGSTVRHVRHTDAIWFDLSVLHPAALVRVDVDPEHTVARDLIPDNNSLLVEPDTGTADDWSRWFTALFATLGATAGWWL